MFRLKLLLHWHFSLPCRAISARLRNTRPDQSTPSFGFTEQVIGILPVRIVSTSTPCLYPNGPNRKRNPGIWTTWPSKRLRRFSRIRVFGDFRRG